MFNYNGDLKKITQIIENQSEFSVCANSWKKKHWEVCLFLFEPKIVDDFSTRSETQLEDLNPCAIL